MARVSGRPALGTAKCDSGLPKGNERSDAETAECGIPEPTARKGVADQESAVLAKLVRATRAT